MFGDGHQEKLWLENFQGSEILFCGGYVDDTCCLSYSEHDVGLIRTLVDRAYKINNSWLGLHEDITKLMDISVICDLLLNRRMATWNLFADHILRNYGERI